MLAVSRLRPAALAAALVLAAGTAAHAQATGGEPPAALAGVAPEVVLLRAAGPWDTADGKGFSRVVGLVDHGRMRIFVQWFVTEPGPAKLVEQSEVEEVTRDGLNFTDLRAEAGENDAEVFLDTAPDAGGVRDTYVLVIGAPGELRFGPSTN